MIVCTFECNVQVCAQMSDPDRWFAFSGLAAAAAPSAPRFSMLGPLLSLLLWCSGDVALRLLVNVIGVVHLVVVIASMVLQGIGLNRRL